MGALANSGRKGQGEADFVDVRGERFVNLVQET